MKSMLKILITFAALWASSGQDIAPRCKTAAVPEGICRLINDCPFLLQRTQVLSIAQVFTLYGGCGVDSRGNVNLCCPTEDPKPTSPPVISVPSGSNNFNNNCGQRVVGEGPEWPFLAVIGRTLQGKFIMNCLGAYITNEWVLADGSCVLGKPATEIAPLTLWTQDRARGIKIKRRQISDQTDDGNPSKGVALLQLEKPVSINDYVQTICLPDPHSAETSTELTALLLADQESSFSKKTIDLKFVRRVPGTSATCNGVTASSTNHRIDICTTGHKSCDSPRSILVQSDPETGQYHLIGTGESSLFHCISEVNVYSSVVSHLQWIKSQTSPTSNQPQPLPVQDVRFLPSGTTCGQRVVGEGPEFPFLVAIGRVQNGIFTISCSGVILSDLWVLTEARCLIEKFVSHIKVAINTPKERTVEVAARVSHDTFDATTNRANIALLKLKSQLIFDDYVQPACFPSIDLSANSMLAIYIIADTSSPDLKKTSTVVTYLSKEKCAATGAVSHLSNPHTICTSSDDSCTYNTRYMLLQANPSSSGSVIEAIGGTNNSPCIAKARVYTRVFPYRHWISETIARRSLN